VTALLVVLDPSVTLGLKFQLPPRVEMFLILRGTGKVHPRTGHEGPGGGGVEV
jgi:hypothetical protein